MRAVGRFLAREPIALFSIVATFVLAVIQIYVSGVHYSAYIVIGNHDFAASAEEGALPGDLFYVDFNILNDGNRPLLLTEVRAFRTKTSVTCEDGYEYHRSVPASTTELRMVPILGPTSIAAQEIRSISVNFRMILDEPFEVGEKACLLFEYYKSNGDRFVAYAPVFDRVNATVTTFGTGVARQMF